MFTQGKEDVRFERTNDLYFIRRCSSQLIKLPLKENDVYILNFFIKFQNFFFKKCSYKFFFSPNLKILVTRPKIMDILVILSIVVIS